VTVSRPVCDFVDHDWFVRGLSIQYAFQTGDGKPAWTGHFMGKILQGAKLCIRCIRQVSQSL